MSACLTTPTRPRGLVVSLRTGNAIHEATEPAAVESEQKAGVDGQADVHWTRPVVAAVERFHHHVRAKSRESDAELVREDVRHAVAVGANRATRAPKALHGI